LGSETVPKESKGKKKNGNEMLTTPPTMVMDSLAKGILKTIPAVSAGEW
jgi:hypothetical protein